MIAAGKEITNMIIGARGFKIASTMIKETMLIRLLIIVNVELRI